MKVEILSRELIKPYTPTPPSLRDYNISLVDELQAGSMNFPILLYYSNDIAIENNVVVMTSTHEERCKHLKMSLAKALTRFYPLAGRYMEESYMVDCSDQGAEFVEAKVDVRLDDLIGQKKSLKVELLDSLLPPCDPLGRAADEVVTADPPLLVVQLSVFACGGYTIGLLNSHKVSDMSTTSMFLMEWAHNAKRRLLESTINHDENDDHLPAMSPIWTSPLLFPAKKCFKFSPPPENIPRPKEYVAADNDHQIIITKILFFSNSAITRIREKAKLDRLPTRVQSVFGLVGKAIIDIHDIAKSGKPQVFSMHQSFNMRERTDPPIPKKQCGNLLLVALAQSMADDEGGVHHLQSIVDLLTCSVKREVEKCKTMLSNGDEGQMIITKSFIESFKLFLEPDSACNIVFSDWCKFQFYEADFGWGKPVWVSSATIPVKNMVCLFSDKTGEGIEAWVHLNVKDMPKFEQDSNIMEFTT